MLSSITGRSLDMSGHKVRKFPPYLAFEGGAMLTDDYFEVPAGYNDADLEMAALTAKANRSAALRKRGICDHGWVQGLGADGTWRGEGPAPASGHVLCLYCGEHVLDPFAR